MAIKAINNTTNFNRLVFTLLVYVTDLISGIVQVLKGDLYWVKISAQEAGLIEPVEL